MSRCITMMTMTGEEGDGDDDIAGSMQKYTGPLGMELPISVTIICIELPPVSTTLVKVYRSPISQNVTLEDRVGKGG